jgi:Zn-dependent protease with chaperone function
MPRLLVGMFYNFPKFGLFLWFTYFVSSVVASIVAIVVTVWALAELIEYVWGGRSIEIELFRHLGLWLLVAVSGILIALINLKTEPLIEKANIARKDLSRASKLVGEFEGISIYEITFPVPLAFVAKIQGKHAILVSNSALVQLTKTELEAMYWHELGHIRGRHNLVRSIAKAVALITPILAASKLFTAETDHLTEILADNFAKKQVDEKILTRTRAKFLE